jgi:hypothetical protein
LKAVRNERRIVGNCQRQTMIENSDKTALLHLGEFFSCQSIQIKAIAQGPRNCVPADRSTEASLHLGSATRESKEEGPKKRELSIPVKKPEIVDFRPFKQKIIPLFPPTSHLRKLSEGEKDFVDKAEITIRMFVYMNS